MRFRSGLLAALAACSLAAGQESTLDVSMRVHYTHTEGVRHSLRDTSTVIWLEPIDARETPAPGSYSMVQKSKSFHPGLLVVPVGSTVSFPNADPFFHNVFSLFNGRRFDLGLYQSGQSRTILFNREGVSYIFCNIHPEMRAVIISLKTSYFASPDAEGVARLHAVPAGSYRLEVWSELASATLLQSLSRIVKIDRDHSVLDEVEIPASSSVLEDHLNKFGQTYNTHAPESSY